MSKRELPKVVADILKELSATIKKFNANAEFNFKLVAKTDDDFLLRIYPSRYEELFFQINTFEVGNINKNLRFDVDIDIEVFRKIVKINPNLAFRPHKRLSFNRDTLISSFENYISVLIEVFPTIIGYNTIPMDLSKLFEIEEEDELTPEPNTFESKDKILPYSLKQLKVKDFQGVNQEGTSIDEIPVDAQWIFLVGENGFGKTTILQSIFLGLNGIMDDNTNLLDDKNSSIKVEYKSLDGSVINNIRDNKNPLIHLAAYGPGRLNLQGVKSENAEDRNNSISYNLFNSDGFLFNINVDLSIWALTQDSRFGLVKKAICKLIPNLENIKYNGETNLIEYFEREINGEDDNITYTPLPFKKLASGFKSIIALAGDMIVRLSKNQPKVKDPSELKGIVLIDEIDLHLHPKLQKQLIGQFSKVFPKIQFIVSTHSPIPLLGAESNSVILKVNRTKEHGIQVEKVDIDLKNLTPNLVLTSGIFDMEDFISIQNENISEVRTEDSMTEMEENDKVAKYLEEFEKSDANFPDELFLPKTSK